MRVLKFGGTSVGDGERIASAARIAAAAAGEGPPLVVVSAMAGVTDLLIRLSRAARGKDRADVDDALRALGARHEAAVSALALCPGAAERCRKEIASELVRLGDLSVGVSLLGELSPRIADAIASSGELLASTLFEAAL